MAEPQLRVIPLGVGDAFSARHYTTCLALGAGDDWLLVDCPHPVRKMLREAAEAAGLALDLDGVSAVLLSHLHGDHVSGLEDYTYYSHIFLKRRARLLAHPDVVARLWSGVLGAGMAESRPDPAGPPVVRAFEDFFDWTPLDAARPVTFGPFRVECRRTVHPIPTTAFRVTAHGRVFGFSADTAYDPSLIEWLAPADLIVHEAIALPESAAHTPYARLAALPEGLRRKMRLFHYDDTFDTDTDASAVEPLRQGRVYLV